MDEKINCDEDCDDDVEILTSERTDKINKYLDCKNNGTETLEEIWNKKAFAFNAIINFLAGKGLQEQDLLKFKELLNSYIKEYKEYAIIYR